MTHRSRDDPYYTECGDEDAYKQCIFCGETVYGLGNFRWHIDTCLEHPVTKRVLRRAGYDRMDTDPNEPLPDILVIYESDIHKDNPRALQILIARAQNEGNIVAVV